MKRLFTLLFCAFSVVTGFAQNDNDGPNQLDQSAISQRTAALELLYEEGKYLNDNGTAAQIEANRIAIKNEWATINPEIASLYKPINAPTYSRLGEGPTPYVPTEIVERPDPLPPTRDWGDDILIRDDFVDGVDMEVTANTDFIYVGMYENDIDAGGPNDPIYVYRSSDQGASWTLWGEQTSVTPIRKIQLVSLDGDGDNYLIMYILFEGGLFQAARWNMANAAFDFQTVQTTVTDFGLDRNFPAATSSMRVQATYLKDGFCPTELFSARSTVGSYGFDWVDEVSVDAVCGDQVDFAYGRAGSSYVGYTGGVSGNLYNNFNDSFTDPASWSARETIVLGANRETLNPTIRASRLSLPGDKVVIWTSDRASGTAGEFNGRGYLRETSGAFALFSSFNSGGPDWNIAHTDGWIRRVASVEPIRFTYVRDRIDNSENDVNRSLTFNGTDFDAFDPVSDSTVDVFDGFASATAETADALPCLAFAGTNGNRGFGLYFDTEAEIILGTQDNIIEGLNYYPNPTQDKMTVSAASEINSIMVYSILGQKVLELTPNKKQTIVNTAALATGVYVMQVTVGKQTGSFKVLKN